VTECTFLIAEKMECADIVNYLAGDINLFFNDYDRPHVCEVSIMVAEEKYRGKGFAKEALYLMMNYGIDRLNVERYYCKINQENETSLALFESIGFVRVNYVEAFGEYELEFLTGEDQFENRQLLRLKFSKSKYKSFEL